MVYEIVTWSVIAIGWLALVVRNRPNDYYQTYREADRERRLGGPRQAQMFDLALDTGDIPHDADRKGWRNELTGRTDWLERVLLTATFCALAWDMYQRAQGQTFQEIARYALILATIAGVIWLAFWLIPTPKIDAQNTARKRLLDLLEEERTLLEKKQTEYRVVAPVGSRRTLRRRGDRNAS